MPGRRAAGDNAGMSPIRSPLAAIGWMLAAVATFSLMDAGMKQLAKNGLRYPIAPYGIQADVRAGMGVSYKK